MQKSEIYAVWTEEEAMKKVMPVLMKAGFESIQNLPKKAIGYVQKHQDLPPQLRSSATSNGEQRVRVLVPNAQGLYHTT